MYNLFLMNSEGKKYEKHKKMFNKQMKAIYCILMFYPEMFTYINTLKHPLYQEDKNTFTRIKLSLLKHHIKIKALY